MPGRPRPTEALAFLRKWGLLQLQDARFPSLVALICGGSVRGSWWSHPKSSEIFHTADALADHADVLVTKLVSGKVTFVHRQLWPALIAIGRAREPWQMAGLTAAARELLERVDVQGQVRATGPVARQLQLRLLVASREVHTRTGAHAVELMTWKTFAREARQRTPRLSASEARDQVDTLLGRINAAFGCAGKAPWGSAR